MNGGFEDYTEHATAAGAAWSVAIMLAFVTLALVFMKKSGFRAMVAVGKG